MTILHCPRETQHQVCFAVQPGDVTVVHSTTNRPVRGVNELIYQYIEITGYFSYPGRATADCTAPRFPGHFQHETNVTRLARLAGGSWRLAKIGRALLSFLALPYIDWSRALEL